LADPNPGRWQGQPLASLRRRKLWSIIERSPSQARFPGGESFLEVQTRVVTQLEAIRRDHGGRRSAVACVTHGDPIRLAVAFYLGLPLDLFQRLIVEPASITVLHLSDGRAVLARLNDTRATRLAGRG
jgi:probable phosphoglycerate mutase